MAFPITLNLIIYFLLSLCFYQASIKLIPALDYFGIEIHDTPPTCTIAPVVPVTMSELKVGDAFPEGVKFSYVPFTDEKAEVTSCGIPINYDASKEFKGKKVVLFSVPGAFTPGCSAYHLPGYIDNLSKLKAKGVDIVAVIAFNDAYVMSAWGKANGIKNHDILFLSDEGAEFSKQIGWTRGERTARYALIIEDGKIIYAEKEPGREVTVSSADAVLAKL